MAVTADQQRVKTLLTETIILLCKNGLHFKNEFTVEGLIGITIDNNDVFLINIKETIQLGNQLINSHLDTFHLKKPHLRKRRYNSHASSNLSKHGSDMSDCEQVVRNASGNDLISPDKYTSYFSKSSQISEMMPERPTHLPVMCPRIGYNNSNWSVDASINVQHPEFLTCSDSYSSFQTTDNSGVFTSPEIKNSNDRNILENSNTPDGHGDLNRDEPKNIKAKSNSSQKECDSNFCLFPLKVKEEAQDVGEIDQCQVVTSPKYTDNERSFIDNQPTCSGLKYSLVDSSVIAYPSLDHQTFQLYHNAEQLEQQVELLPGSGVYISMRAYIHLNKETWARGSKLVRRVVREVFPDEHILARSSCLGRRLSGCHVGLDHHKVDTIKAFVQQRMPQVSHTEIVAAINECCRDIRAKLRKSYFRSANSSTIKPL